MAIRRDYKVLLSNKLDQLNHQGYTILERWELLSWYGRDRITNVVWRDIQETWESYDWSAIKSGAPEIGVIKTDESTSCQTFVLVRKNSVRSIEKLV